ncbi:phosphonopyruvate decarboxylase [Pseudolabrys sp.]|uniref:phosphonopyruvate decarboxylase n=1 Tax=Pseudolabrys sp. TaxID=1960880 RepID=UPI003D0AAD12
MIDPIKFVAALKESGVSLFTGVPDSLLKSVCDCVDSEFANMHRSATNEGSAIGLAIGWYLGAGRPALVYMQNSGFGNAVNPLISLADAQVYGVPMVLLVGWRGEIMNGQQLHDEPQHVKQGAISQALLKLLDIPFEVLGGECTEPAALAKRAVDMAFARRGPAAILVRKNTFLPYLIKSPSRVNSVSAFPLTREAAIELVIGELNDDARIVSTTGMASRELFELRARRGGRHDLDFLTVGGMGHASQIATGLAQSRPDLRIICLDGDGALLMHLGGLANSAIQSNLLHIVLNNECHDSVGGQPTRAAGLALSRVAKSLGYINIMSVSLPDTVAPAVRNLLTSKGSSFLEIKCRAGARTNLGRPTRTARQNVDDFTASLARFEKG